MVVDTVSRALAGGDENDPAVMGALVRATDEIREATDAAVLAIHHSGKDTTRGARGHSLLRAAVDTEIEVTATGEERAATVTKQRDLASGQRIGFRLRVVDLGHDLAGEPVTSCIVEPAEATTGPRVTATERAALRVLLDLVIEEGTALPPGTGWPDTPGLRAVPEARWRAEADSRRAVSTADSTESRARAFRRAYQALLTGRLVATRDGLVWPTRPEGSP